MAWAQAMNIKGPQGDPGTPGQDGQNGQDGNDGARGATWFPGTGAPGVIPGSLPGDFYLDLATGDVYLLS